MGDIRLTATTELAGVSLLRKGVSIRNNLQVARVIHTDLVKQLFDVF
jgi:hypothetical protein